MPTRRTHRKSRHGCKACKQRRVKCDEVRPVCSNCSQRDETCEYVAESSLIWAADEPARPRSRRRNKPSRESTVDASPSPNAPFWLLGGFADGSTPSTSTATSTAVPTVDLTQMRLLVNWQNETCQFFSRDTDTRIVWQLHLVDEALKSPSLMHGILAVSALHFALSEAPSEQPFWLELATAHKGQALHALREGIRQVTPENSRTLMGLSALVVAYAFGSALTAVSESEKPGLAALNNVFVLCRGVQQITSKAHSFLCTSNFAPLFTPGDPPVQIPDHVQRSLDHLDRLNTDCLHAGAHDAATYTRVISALRGLSAHAFAQPNSMTLPAGWAIRVSPEYLEYLQAKAPLALVVHAHYCVFLHMARWNPFLQLWGRAVLEDVLQLLDPSWMVHVEWPIREVLGEGYQSAAI
ncbi:hypothetical protein ASPCAL12430 [Aspergillus calidoustus]|uniref:Zn(2)-C6 fungal-type domain-containing protein n=1 Tax=Aspergillus calidoustus TaxID=454130 RepID=A0A0U5CFS9_ASPCI|nr:hypothetical protein ASPCAL12430 [Aspergillus calidoustus]